MVPATPTLSRRQLLHGVGGLAATTATAGTAAGLSRPTLLPDGIAEAAVNAYPTPPAVSSYWRPTVTRSHAEWAVDLLAETVAEADRLDDRIDAERRFTGAGGWLENARDDLASGNHHAALADATYGMQFAADDLGRAMERLDEVDVDELEPRARQIRERATGVRDDLDPYPVVDPGVDLAWYHHVELRVLQARTLAEWYVEPGEGSTLDRHEVGELLSRLRRAAIHVETAERWRDHLDERLSGPTTAYDGHLRGVAADLRDAMGGVPTQDEARSRRGLTDLDESATVHQIAHAELIRRCLPDTFAAPWEVSIPEGYLVLRAVALSRGLAKARAYEFAVDELVVDPDDGGFDPGHVLAEKRRAREAHRSALGSDPPPLLTRQAGRAVEDLQVATIEHGSWERWRERLDAYLYALTGRAKLREYPTLYEGIADPS